MRSKQRVSWWSHQACSKVANDAGIKVEIHCGIKNTPEVRTLDMGNQKDIKTLPTTRNPIHSIAKTADAGRPTGKNQCSENASLHPGINKKLCQALFNTFAVNLLTSSGWFFILSQMMLDLWTEWITGSAVQTWLWKPLKALFRISSS